jgi:anti-sigma factor RsiW
MNHEEIHELIHPYADGELDVVNAREIEQHLSGCEDCRRVEQRVRALRNALAKNAPAFRAPARLRRNVRAALRHEAKPAGKFFTPWLFVAAGAACALLILGFVLLQTTRASRDAIADQIVANHVRSLLATHLVDVASSEQHTVKPWFDGKVDFAPEVRDLSAEGFPLVGGRLDYLDGKTVIALVYQRNKHPINLFIEPTSTSRNPALSMLTRRGYNLVHWTHGEMDYWAVSDLNATELRQFAAHFAP